MDIQEFKKNAHNIVDWIFKYFENIEKYPVKSQISPNEILEKLPVSPPYASEPFSEIFKDFEDIIIPGITHWQHPCFFAYFPANSSYPSLLAEMLTAALGTQCMIWQTSPAAAELEEKVMKWLAKMIGLPENFEGVIQDTASTATLCSILTAREKYSKYMINEKGFSGNIKYTVYCSSETHSSIEKDVKIAGIGKENLRKIDVDENYAMIPEKLEKSIENDTKRGYTPLCVVATLGTTGSTAIDPLKQIGKICKKFNIWLHVDAAFAGTALVLPEFRWMIEGIENVDTFVFNPHKWMFTNFDCSAYFVKDKEALIRTFEIMPEYLKTEEADRVNNYRDWGIQLGRRFRALKLWFVIRSFGVKGLKDKIKYHINLAQNIVKKIENSDEFEILAPVPFNVICFRFVPRGFKKVDDINKINSVVLEKLNNTGEVYFTHTKLNGIYTIRFVIGQTYVTEKHVQKAWDLIKKISNKVKEEFA